MKPAAAEIFGKIYTTYNVTHNNERFTYHTCGNIKKTTECFDSGTIKGFGHICDMLLGAEHIAFNTMKQQVYVFDSNYNGSPDLFLHVYDRTLIIKGSSHSATFHKHELIDLGIPGGSEVTCFAAANDKEIVAGTSTSTSAATVEKKGFSVGTIAGFSPPIPVISILADELGFISVNFNGGFVLVGPTGIIADGGATAYVVNQENAVLPLLVEP